MMLSRNSFSVRLSLNVILVVNAFFILAIAVIAVSSHSLISEEATKAASNLLKANIGKIENVLSSVESEVRLAAIEVLENKNSEENLYKMTRSILEACENVSGSAIAFKSGYFPDKHYFSPYSYRDENGKIVSMQLGREDYDYFFMDWYQIPSLLGEPIWTEPYFDEGGGSHLMSTYSFPLKDENGEVFAIVTADINLGQFSRIISGIKPYENSYTLLISRNGSFMAHLDKANLKGETIISTALQVSDPAVLEIGKCMLNGEAGMKQFRQNNKKCFAVYGPLFNGWSAATVCLYKDVLAKTSEMHLILILLGLLGIGIVFLLCYFTIRRLTRPLTQFSESVISIASGNFQTELPVITSQDEIRQLRDSFQYMQASLTQYMEDLKNKTAVNERIESELSIARKIQLDMLPHNFPHNQDVDLSAALVPAKEIGGDLYDFFIMDGNLYFAIGDVSGKGVPAALIMAITRASFRFVASLGLEMNEAMKKINNFVASGNEMGNFVTLFIGKFNFNTRVLDFCNGGHNPIIIASPGEEPRYLKVKPNIAAGLIEDFPYETESLTLKKDTHLLLYTDGVTEAETASLDQYGEARLLEWAKNSIRHAQDANSAAQSLLEDVHAFTGHNEQNDDITILTIKL